MCREYRAKFFPFAPNDGNVLASGAPNEDSAGADEADNSAMDSGAVYVFARAGTT